MDSVREASSSTTDSRDPAKHAQWARGEMKRPTPCIVCGEATKPSRLPGLTSCPQCGMISADVAISDSELTQLYGRDYFHGKEYFDYVAEEPSLALNFRLRIATLQRLIPDLAKADLFEIGCAYGFFLHAVRDAVGSASGIDIASDAVAFAKTKRGVDARHGDYLTTDLGRKVDIVTLWDTVEHLKRPDLFAEKLAHDVRPGGHIALTTGDIGSLNARLRGRHWRMIHPPTHLHYFSVRSMRQLLDKHGFDVIHVSHPGQSRTVGAIAYLILALRMGWPALYRHVERLPIARWRLSLNLFDIMFVVARRR
jgi:SAM-dependent methyltransferase